MFSVFFRRFTVYGVVLIFMASCQNTSPLNLTIKKRAVLFKSSAIALEAPNQYQVKLRWAPGVLKDERAEEKTWMIYRAQGSNAPAPYLTLTAGQTE
ncbi:MAG: hypothetical protein ACKOA8_11680, partial [Deltaproteobacteria bacterium]